jgi:Protein of unknown function (DUF3108)
MSKQRSTFALFLATCTATATATETQVTPFYARYQAEWRGINAGTGDFKLSRGAEPGHYTYVSHLNARGIFRLYRSNEQTMSSSFLITDHAVQPLQFRSNGELPGPGDDTALDFDWTAGRVTGASETRPVDLELKPGVQDVMSVQIVVIKDLLNNRLAKTYVLVDKNEIKEFNYTNLGPARLETSIGPLDTLVVASRASNSNKVTTMWFATALGYVPVRAERTRGGKLEFALRIKRLEREAGPTAAASAKLKKP